MYRVKEKERQRPRTLDFLGYNNLSFGVCGDSMITWCCFGFVGGRDKAIWKG